MKGAGQFATDKLQATIEKRRSVRARLEQDREYVAQKARPLIDEEMSLDDEEGTQPGSVNNAPNAMRLQASKNMNSNSYYLNKDPSSTIQQDTLTDFAQPMDLRYFHSNKRISYDLRPTGAPEIVDIEEPKKEDAFSHVSVKGHQHSQRQNKQMMSTF